MKIHFGLELDEHPFPKRKNTTGNFRFFGKNGLLHLLETHLGLAGHVNNNEHLRIEQFRQALRIHLTENPECFFKASFEADQLSTASTLLSMRDELVLSGWNFQSDLMTPKRLQTIISIENSIGQPGLALISWLPGAAGPASADLILCLLCYLCFVN